LFKPPLDIIQQRFYNIFILIVKNVFFLFTHLIEKIFAKTLLKYVSKIGQKPANPYIIRVPAFLAFKKTCQI